MAETTAGTNPYVTVNLDYTMMSQVTKAHSRMSMRLSPEVMRF